MKAMNTILHNMKRLAILSHAEKVMNFFSTAPGQYILLLTAIGMESHMSAPVMMGMIATLPMPPKPAALPLDISISGRYYCNANITNTNNGDLTEVTLMYNTCTGNIIGLPTNAARHSFGYNMTRRNIERSKSGIFYWGADMRNKGYYPSLAHPLFLLDNGNLASAKISKTVTGGYEVAADDMHTVVVFSRTGNFGDKSAVANEISELAAIIENEYTYTKGYTA